MTTLMLNQCRCFVKQTKDRVVSKHTVQLIPSIFSVILLPKTSQGLSSSSANTGIPMYKNRLQGYAQRLWLQLPKYEFLNEGFQHAPKFRASVSIDGTIYKSQGKFSTLRPAEQDAARLALEGLAKKKKNDSNQSHLLLGPRSWKSVLYEFASKNNKRFPRYNITQLEDNGPVYTASLVFAGETYTGGATKSEQEAEQLAAKAAIQSLLGTGARDSLNLIIASKGKESATNKIILALPVQLGASMQPLNKPKAGGQGSQSANLTSTRQRLRNLQRCAMASPRDFSF